MRRRKYSTHVMILALLAACGGGNAVAGSDDGAPAADADAPDAIAADAPGIDADAPDAIAADGSDSAPDVASDGTTAGDALPDPGPPEAVLRHHRNASRDGLYVDAALTRAAAAGVHLDASFANRLPAGPAPLFYAQPLFFPGGPGGRDVIVAASEHDVVYALDAADGSVVWSTTLGTPVPLSSLPCGNIDPLGVTGTPVIDPATRTIYVDGMTTPDGGTTKKHLVFALSLDDGHVLSGWPVDVSATAGFGGVGFTSTVQNQRGALAFLDGTVYVPYGGLAGDCGDYNGWLVAIPAADPAGVTAWATGARGGGAWAPGGVASDGASLFIATGNTFATTVWAGGEAILRFTAGPTLADWFAPHDWLALDAGDTDLGGSGPVLVDVPGATPSALVVSLGKNGKIYLLDRGDLGHVGPPDGLFSGQVSSDEIINAATAYTTATATYVVFKGAGTACPGAAGDLVAVRIVPGAPPTVATAWCALQNGLGSPTATTIDGHAESVVWSVGAEGDQKLHGFDGDTGQEIVAVAAGPFRRYVTPMLAGGRLFVGGEDQVYAFAF